MDWQTRVTKEKSLLEVYWKARKIASPKHSWKIAGVIFVVLFGFLISDWYFNLELVSFCGMFNFVSKIGEIGFAMTTAILGFLITGFAIFSTFARVETFVALARIPYKETEFCRLQFVFFNFLLIFIHYLAFLTFSISIKIFLPTLEFVNELISPFWSHWESFVWWPAAIFTSLSLSWLVYIILLLMSFIWNLYQAVLLVIVTDDYVTQINQHAQQDQSSK